jgi:transposase
MNATIDTNASQNPTATNGQPQRKRRAWTPRDRDHLIYQWVKFDGKTQLAAAADFDISQSTVSRIIERYERWQAHAADREGGRLDPAERRRAQRWLTYERNERILASALRIADRMEGVTELHKSVRTRPLSEWHKEGTEIRSEEHSVDRHGVAARFLRLAFRINVEQLKLVEQDPPAMPQPLSEEELSAEEARDQVVAENLAAAERRAQQQVAAQTADRGDSAAAEPAGEPENLAEATETAGEVVPNLHKVHSGPARNSALSADQACLCAADRLCEKTADEACIADTNRERQRESNRFCQADAAELAAT